MKRKATKAKRAEPSTGQAAERDGRSSPFWQPEIDRVELSVHDLATGAGFHIAVARAPRGARWTEGRARARCADRRATAHYGRDCRLPDHTGGPDERRQARRGKNRTRLAPRLRIEEVRGTGAKSGGPLGVHARAQIAHHA